MLMTPVLLGQFRLFYDQQKPIGVVFWAHASTEVAERLAQGVTRLRPQDWKSGEELWVMPEACFQHDEVMAPFGGVTPEACFQHDEMVKDLKAKVFPGRELKVLALEGGRHGVKVV